MTQPFSDEMLRSRCQMCGWAHGPPLDFRRPRFRAGRLEWPCDNCGHVALTETWEATRSASALPAPEER